MKRLKTSIAAWSALATAIVFGITAAFFPPENVRDVGYALVTGMSAAAIIRWSPDAARSFRGGRAGFEFLIVGVFSVLSVILCHRLWIMATVYLPNVEAPLVTYFVVWMLAWSCGLILVAPDIEDGAIANRSMVLIGVALFIAGVVSGASLAWTIAGG